MKYLALLTLAFLSSMCTAQLGNYRLPVRPVTDPFNVVVDRGATIEVLSAQRAVPAASANGQVVSHRMIATAPDSQIGPKQLGLLYNRALQQYGVFSGEISFKMKSNPVAATFDPNLYPGLKRIVAPSVYVVNTRTPAEFMTVMKRLQARSDVAWVEPTITYTAVK